MCQTILQKDIWVYECALRLFKMFLNFVTELNGTKNETTLVGSLWTEYTTY